MLPLVASGTMSVSTDDRYLSAEEAAQYCRVSTKTVLRWLDAGTLKADKSGRAYRIPVRDLEPFRRHETGHTPDGGQHQTSPTLDATPTIVDTEAPHLAALVRDLQAQLLQAAATAAMYQERCATLAAQLAALQQPALEAGTVNHSEASESRPWWLRWPWWWRDG
jgi:excisionase family DNA binding protein